MCTGICPCGLTDETINKYYKTGSDFARINLMERFWAGATKFQDCDIAQVYNEEYHSMFDILEDI